MRTLVVQLAVALAVGAIACTGADASRVQVGMSEAEVREALGEPTQNREVGDNPIYVPQDARCKDVARRCLVYESWSEHTVLVFFDSEMRVVCVEKSILHRSHD